jgi:hypothetical protein
MQLTDIPTFLLLLPPRSIEAVILSLIFLDHAYHISTRSLPRVFVTALEYIYQYIQILSRLRTELARLGSEAWRITLTT